MALINIIAKSEKVINWKNFLKDFSNLNILNIEVFPIPKELGFDHDSVGINIHRGYAEKDVVIFEVERLVMFFGSEPYYFKFIELYDGVEINAANVLHLIGGLLPVS